MTITSTDVKRWFSNLLTFVIVISIIGLFVGFMVYSGYQDGVKDTMKKYKAEAIANGVAYWSVNPTNGETLFEWIKK